LSSAVLALLAVPAAAAASPTLAVDRPCYTPGQQIRVSGQGYTPNGALNLHFDFLGSDHTTADAGGVAADAQGFLSHLFTAPEVTAPNDVREQVTLTSSDSQLGPPGSPQSTAQTQFLLSRGLVRVPAWGGRFSLTGKSKITVSGFVGGSTSNLYAHYVRDGKLRRTVKVGKLTGPCGDFIGKVPNTPFKPKVGKYRVRFDTARHYPNRSAGADLHYRIRFVRR
jgi:hypothetical protein